MEDKENNANEPKSEHCNTESDEEVDEFLMEKLVTHMVNGDRTHKYGHVGENLF